MCLTNASERPFEFEASGMTDTWTDEDLADEDDEMDLSRRPVDALSATELGDLIMC